MCGEHTCSSSFYEEESRVNTRNVISGVVDSIAHGAGWGWGQTEAPPGGTATPLLRLTAVWYDFLVEVRNQIFKNTWKSSFKNIGS